MKYDIAVVPGDGIGPEIMAEAVKVLEAVGRKFGHDFVFNEYLAGGIAIDKRGEPLPEETLEGCRKSGAILFGSVGGPKWDDARWDNVHGAPTPSRAIQLLRHVFQLYANLRPAKANPYLESMSPLKPGYSRLCRTAPAHQAARADIEPPHPKAAARPCCDTPCPSRPA